STRPSSRRARPRARAGSRSRSSCIGLYGGVRRALVGVAKRLIPLDGRNDAAVAGDACVPGGVGRLELVELEAALGEADRLTRVEADPVLVPGDVPGDRDHELAVHARELQDARAGLAEALRDPAHGAAKRARVEEVGRLDDLELGLRQAPQDRLADDGL